MPYIHAHKKYAIPMKTYLKRNLRYLAASRRGWFRRMKSGLLQIIIIVISVSTTIGFQNFNMKKKQQNEVKEFLCDIKIDITKDIQAVEESKRSILADIETYKMVLSSCTGSPKKIDVSLNISSLQTNSGNYEGFKSSGKICYINNKEIKRGILAYYQDMLPKLHFGYDIYNNQIMKTIDSIYAPSTDIDSLPKAKMYLKQDLGIALSIVAAYDQYIKESKALLHSIEKEINA